MVCDREAVSRPRPRLGEVSTSGAGVVFAEPNEGCGVCGLPMGLEARACCPRARAARNYAPTREQFDERRRAILAARGVDREDVPEWKWTTGGNHALFATEKG